MLSASSRGSGAAALSVPGLLKLQAFYQLSLCDIHDGERYTALVTEHDDPKPPDSVRTPTLVGLTADGYDPAKCGGL